VRMMVSQPRRIAATSLMKRLRTSIGDAVGMRMGHGIRDETASTKIFFVTTGYLMRLIAHYPEVFERHTHLIIDEVHERSIDSDLVCLLARRLLQRFKHLKLVLMSATIHTELYRQYFAREDDAYGKLECLSVGVRRFPLEIFYVEDLLGLETTKSTHGYEVGPVERCSEKETSSSSAAAAIRNISGAHNRRRSIALSDVCKEHARNLRTLCKTASNGLSSDSVAANIAKEQYSLTVAIIKQVAVNGSGILVFVSGIADITELMEKFEQMRRYRVFAIHSEIPFEEQLEAFEPCRHDEVKVVIATNAAESSITLPDVDVVICLGTHKALRYRAENHRVQLVNTWVSKASATQRAGRTGRVRPGSVFRLYTSSLFAHFADHDQAEVNRQPLQDVILDLRSMLEDTVNFRGTVPILEELLEPPDTSNIQKVCDHHRHVFVSQ
jgi:HrpA-like RNA helicase